ncbi:hypothetical protein HFP15_17275 [Amycolatopsis sp. K13G38]|uniref:Uncharacterized protein n=1 Tax=Amycolatopsis acididurans TaxID=2724524 RepID=A0ABX1J4B7_9PSEU|nr:hypothetical protein [Amycolatopsis acididurans]NKQ54636.1 hypothetical protein [Amycolatopsis acididurans]
MPYKITHRSRPQEILFPTQLAAEDYAHRFGGGLENWKLVAAGTERKQDPAAESTMD